ncbi:hypothetical protein CBI38_34060 (plasmid) [Rhodococcus oxybenzonivorans]|uniref:Uncharacterized protein n=1 Tax=Rhodococcus oxybenzonivorans TaxID=1990687 RepID=A0A2S2C6J9_9NOCA|nr:hypothetical protein CBI38_34060 [Rhodococcus oxybenzonivorans]
MTCPHCSKRTYFTRKDARAARTHHEKRQGLSIYPCPHQGEDRDGFHVGHRPKSLTRGTIGRGNLAASQRESPHHQHRATEDASRRR